MKRHFCGEKHLISNKKRKIRKQDIEKYKKTRSEKGNETRGRKPKTDANPKGRDRASKENDGKV